MLEFKGIDKYYNPGTVNEMCLFENFNLTVDDGEFVSVVGSNGSGKTSMLNILCGSIPADSGQILMNGEDITNKKEYKRNRTIGRVYQNPAMGTCPSMTILENMSLADNKGRFYGLGPGINRTRKEHYRDLLSQLGLGLEDKMDVKVGSLSGGQRQRACIAMVIAQDTEYILLDEPTNNLDIYHATNMMKIVRRLCDELGKTVILVLHEINYAAFYSDYICAFVDGKIAKFGTVEEVMTKENLAQIYKVDFEIMRIQGKPLSIYY